MRPQSCGNKQRLVSIKADKETQFSNMESKGPKHEMMLILIIKEMYKYQITMLYTLNLYSYMPIIYQKKKNWKKYGKENLWNWMGRKMFTSQDGSYP